MTTYNTGNPLGSADPRDLYDNAENLDEALHTESAGWTDRLGERRMSWKGVQDRVNDLIVAGGRIFESVEAGRSEVNDGDYYLVASDNPNSSLEIWKRNSSSDSSLVAEQASTKQIDRVSSILRERETTPLLEFVLETGEWLGEYNNAGWLLGQAFVEELKTKLHSIGDCSLVPGEGSPLSIEGEDSVIAEIDGDGRWHAQGYLTGSGSGIEASRDNSAVIIATDKGDVIAEIDGEGYLSVIGLKVDGLEVRGGDIPVEVPDYNAPFVSQETIDFINSLDVTDGDGASPPTSKSPPKLSIDRATYGFRYAHLSSSIIWAGNRLWMAAYGQNMRPGEHGEGPGTFVFLRYCDNPFDEGAKWREVMYVVPDPGDPESRLKNPIISLTPDGRLLVQVLARYSGEDVYGFLIDNPQATRGKFTIGRIYWITHGVHGRPKSCGAKYLAVYDSNIQENISKIKTMSFPGLDGIKVEDFVDIPQIDPISDKEIPEGTFSMISAARILYLQRTRFGLAQSVSDPGGQSWTNPLEEWKEYPSPSTRATQETSPSGRIIRVWNNSETARRKKLTIAISEDEGESFPTTFEIQTTSSLKQQVSYPSLDFKMQRGEVILTVSYDYGRELSEEGETQIAMISEDLIMSGRASQSDITYITAAKTSGGL